MNLNFMKKSESLRIIMILSFLVTIVCFTTSCFTETSIPIENTLETEVVSENDSEDANQTLLEANLKSWQLGDRLFLYEGSNRDYDWYLDQAHTGEHAISNCGPTAVAMAAKWADETFEGTPEEAREAFRPKGGWWYNEDIIGSLELFDVDFETLTIEDIYSLREIIDSGYIAIINNSMGYIVREADADAHTNRFYDFDSGHYLIVKGYAIVDHNTYFEVYDPNNWDMTYDDGEPMGKDRYYEASILIDSIKNWYPYVIVIKPNN